jgi:hypothetical protein
MWRPPNAAPYRANSGRIEMKFKLLTGIIFLVFAGAGSGATAAGLPFIHDNYPQALAEAKQRKLPIFVECWAPW